MCAGLCRRIKFIANCVIVFDNFFLCSGSRKTLSSVYVCDLHSVAFQERFSDVCLFYTFRTKKQSGEINNGKKKFLTWMAFKLFSFFPVCSVQCWPMASSIVASLRIELLQKQSAKSRTAYFPLTFITFIFLYVGS